MEKPLGFVFDLDGTLLNSLEDLADAANSSLSKMGFPSHPVEQYKYFVGDGVITLMKRILPPEKAEDEEVCAQFLSAYLAAYDQYWDKKTSPYPGVAELLDALSAAGVRLGVFSNKPHRFTQLCVGKLLSRWHFDAVVGQSDEVPKKPDPTGALLIQKQWGFEPGRIAYVGDTATDMKTAAAAGFFSIGVTWGFRPESELRESGACAIVHRPEEILELWQFA
ncbi:MAG: HAD family hydrolase [Planctomycetia bacterium]|nr:HAD family hydrolase [Planctomycetia bacterium]